MNVPSPSTSVAARPALTREAGTYLRALAQLICPGNEELLKRLPGQEFEQLPTHDTANLTLDNLLLDPTQQLVLWHLQQIKALLAPMAEIERRRCWVYLPDHLAKQLGEDAHFAPLAAWPEPFGREFFRRRFQQFLLAHSPFPIQLLEKSKFDYLLALSAAEMRDLAHLMAIHTLMTPLKHMIEQQKRAQLKTAITRSASGPLLLNYMRYLQSDINEQIGALTVIQFPLYQWDWTLASFEGLLRRFGLYCLAQMLRSQPDNFLDHIALRMEPAESTQFRFLVKREINSPDQGQIAQSLQRLAAKAIDFLSSPQDLHPGTTSPAPS